MQGDSFGSAGEGGAAAGGVPKGMVELGSRVARTTLRTRAALATTIALGVGIALATLQYIARSSLWVDELAITRNVVDRSFIDLLTRPLSFDQVAPVGFLVMEKIAVTLFGPSELALRAFPFVMAIAALFFVAKIAQLLLTPLAAAVPVILLGISAPIIWYAAQAKQYSTDVALSAALIWIALELPRTASRRTRVLMATGGALCPWFSLPSLFVLVAAGGVLAFHLFRSNSRQRRGLYAIVAVWAGSAALSLIAARLRVSPDTLAFMKTYWAGGFPTLPPTTLRDWKWPGYRTRLLFDSLLNTPLGAFYLLVAMYGVVRVWRRSASAALLLVAPFVIAMLAAAARQYPFADRLALFLAPPLVLLVAAGIDGIAHRAVRVDSLWLGLRALRGRARRRMIAGALLLTPPMVGLAMRPPPYEQEDVRPVLAAVAQRAHEGDTFYVPYGAWQAWRHYAPRLGLDRFHAALGTCHGTDVEAYARELETLRGQRRVWIVFVPAGLVDRKEVLLTSADSMGRSELRFERANHDVYGDSAHVGAFLYDFGGAGSVVASNGEVDLMGALGDVAAPADPACHGAAIPPRAASPVH